MIDITQERLAELKSKGFLFMKDKEHFVVRIILPAGMATSDELKKISYLAEKYAEGKAVVTVRLNVEIPGIKYENVEPMMKEMEELGIVYGGTNCGVRPLVCCKGTVCKFGLVDTQKLCKELHDEFFEVPLPHKFKINITGCPNNCAKVQLNDLAFMGAPRNTLRVFVGGRFGRQSIIGEEICKIPYENARDVSRVCCGFFNKYGKSKQRFGDLLVEMKDTEEYVKFIEDIKAFAVQ
ncbi:MAG: hypothetical protein IAC55_07240 [Tyzzerella sp.]|uniref:Uncharacterized protein n=1 Tax=Candidatus Fimicola merdigallinarum TaxID=2840819 RepID=A0A9D9H1C1_9FIRM|nr:hypothetical protein [Candidatus Fimicola merdigallinarum]